MFEVIILVCSWLTLAFLGLDLYLDLTDNNSLIDNINEEKHHD